jgi:hypothetical protein
MNAPALAQPTMTWAAQYPYTVNLGGATEEDRTRLRIVLARATQILALAEPENADAQAVYAELRVYLPVPPKLRAANIVLFPRRTP